MFSFQIQFSSTEQKKDAESFTGILIPAGKSESAEQEFFFIPEENFSDYLHAVRGKDEQSIEKFRSKVRLSNINCSKFTIMPS